MSSDIGPEPTVEAKIIEQIEADFGNFQTPPKIVLVPDLYKQSGALGRTTYLDEPGGSPTLIEVDENLFIYNQPAGYRVLTHELLEWRFIERGEQFHHYLAEKNQSQILASVNITPLHILLWNRPILRQIILGY